MPEVKPETNGGASYMVMYALLAVVALIGWIEYKKRQQKVVFENHDYPLLA